MNAPPLGSPNSFRSARPQQTQGHHRRGSSQSSVASGMSSASAPTATMQMLMQTIQSAPKGSKMAEDASKALIVAEMARQKVTGVPLVHNWTPPSRTREQPPILSPTPSRPESRASHRSRSDSVSSIGRAMLSPPAPIDEEEDPFDLENFDLSGDSITDRYLTFENLLGAPYDGEVHRQWDEAPAYPPPQIPLPPVPLTEVVGPRHPDLRPPSVEPHVSGIMLDRERTPVPPISADLLRTRSQYVRPRDNAFASVASSQNAIGIFWRGIEPQQFTLITEGEGLQETDDPFPIHVAPKNTQVVEIPRAWSGSVQKLSGNVGDPATRCQISFDGQAGLTFFGVTYAYGNNGGVVIRSSPSNVAAGSPFRAAQVASNALCTIDASGARVVLGTTQARPHLQRDLHKFYREFFETAEQGAILEGDPSHIVATRDRHLLLDFN